MRKKTLVMLLSAVLVVSSVAFGTIAYLTDREAITNTFTVGNVDLKLDETHVDRNGQPIKDEQGNEIRREEGNEYHLVPGKTYTKDPRVTVLANSEESYVRMLVTITHIDKVRNVLGQDFLPENHVEGYDSAVWKCVNIQSTTAEVDDPANPGQKINVPAATYEFRYSTTVETMTTKADLPLTPLFTAFTVPGELTGKQLVDIADMEIRVVSQAIQATGFQTEDEAWAAFDAQNTPTPTPSAVPTADPIPAPTNT